MGAARENDAEADSQTALRRQDFDGGVEIVDDSATVDRVDEVDLAAFPKRRLDNLKARFRSLERCELGFCIAFPKSEFLSRVVERIEYLRRSDLGSSEDEQEDQPGWQGPTQKLPNRAMRPEG